MCESRPVVGSSQNNRGGLLSIFDAKASLFISPPATAGCYLLLAWGPKEVFDLPESYRILASAVVNQLAVILRKYIHYRRGKHDNMEKISS